MPVTMLDVADYMKRYYQAFKSNSGITFNPYIMARFMEHLKEKYKYNPEEIKFLRSFPAANKRIPTDRVLQLIRLYDRPANLNLEAIRAIRKVADESG